MTIPRGCLIPSVRAELNQGEALHERGSDDTAWALRILARSLNEFRQPGFAGPSLLSLPSVPWCPPSASILYLSAPPFLVHHPRHASPGLLLSWCGRPAKSWDLISLLFLWLTALLLEPVSEVKFYPCLCVTWDRLISLSFSFSYKEWG